MIKIYFLVCFLILLLAHKNKKIMKKTKEEEMDRICRDVAKTLYKEFEREDLFYECGVSVSKHLTRDKFAMDEKLDGVMVCTRNTDGIDYKIIKIVIDVCEQLNVVAYMRQNYLFITIKEKNK